MPLADANLAATWAGWYKIPLPDGSGYRGYERAAKDQILGADADALIDALIANGMTAGQRIALVGAGFGWVAERFIVRGFGPAADGTTAGRVAAIDTSTWIQANKAGNVVTGVTILNADVNASAGRTAIRTHFGNRNQSIDWCVTEDVLPSLIGTNPALNNEIVPFCQSCRALATKVAHWITPLRGDGTGLPTNQNWKTLADWKTWVTPDLVIERGGGRGVL